MTTKKTDPTETTPPTVEVKTVRVKTLRYHTIDGVAHGPGDEYDVDAAAVASLEAQEMVVRVVEVTPGTTPPAETTPPAQPK